MPLELWSFNVGAEQDEVEPFPCRHGILSAGDGDRS